LICGARRLLRTADDGGEDDGELRLENGDNPIEQMLSFGAEIPRY
jgi:hypothetical protein